MEVLNTKGNKPYLKNNKYTSTDWNLSKPNTIFVGEKSAHFGNVFISVRKWDGRKMIPFRAGHKLNEVHPLTVITIANKNAFKINTKRMYLFLHEKSQTGEIHSELCNFGRCPNDAYRVNIADLVLFSNIEDFPIEEKRLGEIA